MRRLTAVAVLTLAAVPAWPSGAAEPELTSRNSIVAPLVVNESIRFDGVGCGVPASATVSVPAGTTEVRARPSVGATSEDGQITSVTVQGTAVTFTAVGAGSRICDPAAETTPPAERAWSAGFAAEVGFKLRVGVLSIRDAFDSRGKLFRVRPREVRLGICCSVRGIRWTQFGARKAVGNGRFKSLTPCAGGCSDNGTKISVELTRPGRCPRLKLPGHKEDGVFYSRVAFVLRERLGVLKPGRVWIRDDVTCSTAGDKPIPIR